VQFTCNNPYGQYVSLDGVHPNVRGYQLMANAAADALNATYSFTIAKNVQPVLTAAQLCP
jgi:phospholipase/lecithinase/hemolysin